MGGTVPPLTQYVFMAWCPVTGSTGTTLSFTLPLHPNTITAVNLNYLTTPLTVYNVMAEGYVDSKQKPCNEDI